MKEVVARAPIYPGGAGAFTRQLLTAVMDPNNMQQFFSNPDNLQRIITLGLSNLASIHSGLNPDYKLQEMIGMNETPGYRIPGLDPDAETDLAAGGFDYLGPHSPSLPTTPPPSGIPSSTPEPVYFEKLSSNGRFSQVNTQPATTGAQIDESDLPPLPKQTFENFIMSLKKIEKSPISEQDKIANYRTMLSDYSREMAPLRSWLKQNGYGNEFKGVVNEAKKRK
jgi:hypothetical protein